MLKLENINQKLIALINKLDTSRDNNTTLSFVSNLGKFTDKEETLKNIRAFDFSCFYVTKQKPSYIYRFVYSLYTVTTKIIYALVKVFRSTTEK